ncbi:MAG TPA: ABC transporter substrate-binding protein [Lachnospiraceae bacterium]|nr:ABC transporter substrate-binding protein [Lachnospiraceae bacterium]
MKKKILTVILALTAALGLMACGAADKEADVQTAESTESTAEEGQETAEQSDDATYHVEMQILTWGTVPTGLEAVEQAINEVTEPEIGVTVTLNPVAAWDLASESSMAITSGEKMDLICILPYGSGLDSVANYTSKNMLTPLDDLYAEYGQDIAAHVDADVLSLGYQGGNLYAVPVNGILGVTPCFVARTDILDELGISIDEDKVYSLDELEEMFDAYKETYGNGYYCVAAFGGMDMYNMINRIDNLGTDDSDGVLIGAGMDGDTTVVDKFETKEYEDFTYKMYEWYQKGFFSPDVTTITDGTTLILAQGNYFGTFGGISPGIGFETMKAGCGYDLTIIKTAESYTTSGIASMCLWGIPVTSENPEKTMQFLNLLYQDREIGKDIDTMLSIGLEGSDYEVVEEVEGSKAIVKYPEGLDLNTVSWAFTAPIYGNQLTIPNYEPLTTDIYNEYETYNENVLAEGNKSCVFGYVYDSSNMSTQKAAVASVISQYQPILSCGSVDPAEALPEFIQALKDAGIDELVADNQAQLDAWIADR